MEQVRPLIDTKHHHLNVDLPVQPAWVVGDRTRLIQILTNLLTNAAKNTPEHGALDLQVSLDDAWMTIQIKDNGFGIDDDLLPRIFDLFSQGERTSDRAQGGEGKFLLTCPLCICTIFVPPMLDYDTGRLT